MALDADEEILQDFLVEVTEILEKLNEQLVDLEQRPNDRELLNAVFRGFHTIKGGAGFLSVKAVVDVCHCAEDVFNLLRTGQKQVTPQLMDTILPVLDVLNRQVGSLRNREEPASADQSLLDALEALTKADDANAAPPPPAVTGTVSPVAVAPAAVEAPAVPEVPIVPPPSAVSATPARVASETTAAFMPAEVSLAAEAAAAMVAGDITDEEFEALLDALDMPASGAGPVVAVAAAPRAAEAPATPPPAPDSAAGVDGAIADDEISEEEFEALLDQLHGKGKFTGVPVADTAAATGAKAPAATEAATAPSGSGDDITEEEFETLLDQLHGKGRFTGLPGGAAAVPPPAAPNSPSTPPPQVPPRVSPPAAPPARSEPRAVSTPAPAPAAPVAPKPAPASDDDKKGGDHTAQETTVRVDTKRLDDIMNLVGELVLVRNRLSTLAQTDMVQSREEMAKTVANLDVVTGDLQTAVMKTRMQPIKKVFGRFPRVVRDLARGLKKEVNLVLEGEETDLDKNLVEALADPLVHLVRNAVDHGIELPEVRERGGKSRTGTLRLSAQQEGDHILLIIEDDGGGMDPETLRRKAVEKGMMDAEAAARLDEKECFQLIFAAGFSTKSEISDISGRGVGMDVVKTRIAQLNGQVDVDSKKGEGTRIIIKVPLTLAIMPTLMVKLQGQTFALPLPSVSEIFHLDLTKTNIVDGQRVVVVREKALPLFYLTRWLAKEGQGAGLPSMGHVVMVHVGTQQVGFIVDDLIGQEEVVIKPLGALLYGTPGLAGATITGDGKIALILDIPSLLKAYGHRH